MYREVLAFHFCRQHPRVQVLLASPQTLEAEAKRVRPHLIIADEVARELKEMSFWVEVRADEGLVANISANGYSTTVADVTLQELLAVVEKVEEHLAHDGAWLW